MEFGNSGVRDIPNTRILKLHFEKIIKAPLTNC
jgi:hypothetical protein